MRKTNNRFEELVEFPTIWCIKLANILCQNEETAERYLTEYYNPDYEYGYEVINSLQRFRRDIISKRTDVSEYEKKIKECIEIESWSELREVLQNLFLEPLAWSQVLDIVEMIHNGINTINTDDIMKWYEKDKKILAITTFGVEYIKGI
ncbi:MAG: hypothetical protein PHT02_00800 [Tissierellia bacterium]|nr:hypothetical protein [Tissierellia bacterium]